MPGRLVGAHDPTTQSGRNGADLAHGPGDVVHHEGHAGGVHDDAVLGDRLRADHAIGIAVAALIDIGGRLGFLCGRFRRWLSFGGG